ncbi:M13 family metallopeptidase [Phenylobacterium immobile]|uniref:M13 family metallopeptidase n=1 Tax=Phenylobacterium immobile TaxID=21 RepID=UPI000A700F8F|nr:M13-type metalloendopeptidase [Phenylobacterium immobile]
MKRFWLSAAASAALLTATPASASSPPAPADAEPASVSLETPRLGVWGFDMAGRDLSTSPGKSFYGYANGTYVKALTIPADRSRYGAFDAIAELSRNRLRAVIEKTAADPQTGGDLARVAGLYRSFMDEAGVEALGSRPLAADLTQIRAEKTRSDIARGMGASLRKFGGAVIAASVGDDAKNPSAYVVTLNQAGLGLPDRDYYLEASFEAQRAKYEAYVARLLTLAGWPQPLANAKAIVAFETEIAKVSWTGAERRDRDTTYNPLAVKDLATYAPGFDWTAYFAGARLSAADRVVMEENTAIQKIAAVFAATPLDTLKAWQAFTLVDQASPYLSKAFDAAHFDFRDRTLSGQQVQRERWKRGVAAVDQLIGEASGKLYVDAYFPADSKAKMADLVANLRVAMAGRIEKLEWMGPETKARALEKLSKFNVKIGYPDRWRSYDGLMIRDTDLYGNVVRATAFDWDFRAARLNQPVDRGEWAMTTPTVNAYYSSTKNEIVFPAAILQPPFFDPQADDAVNYGGIGGVIGHEITHGFDDQGRKVDGDGRLSDWWTADDAARFKVQAAKLGKQYDAYEALPGAFVKGDLTMGENIADLGGLLMAMDAYHTSLKGKPAPSIEGLTGEQRLFLGWAQGWRTRTREDLVRRLLVSDPHSPPEARVDLPMRNIDAFYDAFGIKPGDPMYVAPANRVRIW